MKTLTDYETQAQEFLTKTRTTFKAKFLRHGKYFPDDKESRNVYRITLKRMGRSYTFLFGQSIKSSMESIEPQPYDVLACLTKSDPGTYQDFCNDYGTDEDSIKGLKLYHSVVKEWNGVERMFGDVLPMLEEIA